MTRDTLLQKQLLGQALKSLEDGRMKMIENIKMDIQDIVDYDKGENKKLKIKEVESRIENINRSFDVIHRASLLKAGIYYEQNEPEAMIQTLNKYSEFLSEHIIGNTELLYQYDCTDKELNGEWHKRAKEIPQEVKMLLESKNDTQHQLEVSYGTLLELGVIENERKDNEM